MEKTRNTLEKMFDALLDAYGPQGWWPGDSRDEIIAGAILTQNTSWTNVEKALARMKSAGLLDWQQINDISQQELAEVIRPAGTFNLKAMRLKNFAGWVLEQDSDWERIASMEPDTLRKQLLAINGVGPETADAILLYALEIPTFVVDAYTFRVARRHHLIEPGADYWHLKQRFEGELESDVRLFNEFHALLVAVGKAHCGTRATCTGCPLALFEHDETIK